MNPLTKPTILIVDDTPEDITILSSILRDDYRVKVATDGGRALRLARSEPFPDIILLDLNLPKKDGREVLAEIKGDSSLRHIPVIILTTSKDQDDIWRSYELQANCFITKPADMEQFTKALECLGKFWLTLVRLPIHPKP